MARPSVIEADADRALEWLRGRPGGRADAVELAAYLRDEIGLSRTQGYAAARALRARAVVRYTPGSGGSHTDRRPGVYETAGAVVEVP